MKSSSGSPPYRVRRSKIHGTGVFATRHIPKGTRILEYLGERISHAEADRRYADKADDDNHTFLFTVDGRTVIDAGVGGNEARWINHSCDPNCETVVEDRRDLHRGDPGRRGRQGARLRLHDRARRGRPAEHRRRVRLPLRRGHLSRHDAVAAEAAAGAARRARARPPAGAQARLT